MLDIITSINSAVNNFVWGWPALVMLSFTGIFMTCLTKFFQVTHIGHWARETIGAIFHDKHVVGHTQDKSISQFQSLCTALAATVGTGNIVGVAGAIMVGGPGAVFWMWIIAFFGMMTNYSENVLGIFYREKGASGEWHGGAMYYLKNGLGAKPGCKALGAGLAALFSVFCLLASFGIGNMTQINSISGNMEAVFGLPNWLTGILLMILAGLVVLGGLKRIALVAEKIVPFMVILYIIGSIVILVTNFSQIGTVFSAIFRGAFAMQAAGGGVVGYGVKLAIEQGMKRGVFSNEAGLGSSVMVHSSSNVKDGVLGAVVRAGGFEYRRDGGSLSGCCPDQGKPGQHGLFDSFRFGGRGIYCDCGNAVRVLYRARVEPLRRHRLPVPVWRKGGLRLPRDFRACGIRRRGYGG